MNEPIQPNNIASNSSAKPLVRCAICNCLTKRLDKHVKKAHPGIQSTTVAPVPTPEKTQSPPERGTCPYCKLTILTRRLKRHIAKAHRSILEAQRRRAYEEALLIAIGGIESESISVREESVLNLFRMTTASISMLSRASGIEGRLVTALQTTPNKTRLIQSLIFRLGPTCIPALLNAKFEMASPELAQALASTHQLATGYASVVPILCKASRHKVAEIRFRATWVLAHLHSDMARNAVDARRRDADPKIRKVALRKILTQRSTEPAEIPQSMHVSPAGLDLSGDTHDLEFYDPDHGH